MNTDDRRPEQEPTASTADLDAPFDLKSALVRLWTRLLNRQMQYGVDIIVLVAAFWLSYLLRFEFRIPGGELHHFLVQLPFVVLLQVLVLQLFGAYSFVWRYISLAEVKTFVKAAVWSAMPLLVLRFSLTEDFAQWRVPLSIIVIDGVLAFGGVLGVRVLRRVLYEHWERRLRESSQDGDGEPVLLVGAGRAGVLVAKEIADRGHLDLDPVGFVDDDDSKQGLVIQGIKVIGRSRDIPRLVREHDVDHVIISISQASRRDIRRIVEICESVPVRVRIIPGLYEILGGDVSVSRIRDVQIEDLLGREPITLDEQGLVDYLGGHTVLITGAGGSIGSELCRQVLRFGVDRLVLLERAEPALFEIDGELRAEVASTEIVPVLADVTSRRRMEQVFRRFRPQVVLHAAAHKHVPMMEANPGEAVSNNVLGTRTVAELAGEYGAESFVLISTDKAVRPTSVMGASKRVAELVAQGMNHRFDTEYLAVRFGNVMGSAGSVIPIFRRQIETGGPVTVTHPDMVRYFMTIPEASQLVLQAASMGDGGEIFILDMGEPVRILDLARDMITLSGLRPYEDVDIVFTGIRPGEKLFEELELHGEAIAKTRHPKIFIGRLSMPGTGEVDRIVAEIARLVDVGSDEEIRAALGVYVPEATLSGLTRPDEPAAPGLN